MVHIHALSSLDSGLSALDPSVAKARVELACPFGHGVLSAACIPVPPLGHVSSPYGNRTRVARMRVSHPEPLDERAMLSVGREGIEPLVAHLTCFATTGLQPAARSTTQWKLRFKLPKNYRPCPCSARDYRVRLFSLARSGASLASSLPLGGLRLLVAREGVEPYPVQPQLCAATSRCGLGTQSSQGETCTPTPKRARRFECRVSADSTTWPLKKPDVDQTPGLRPQPTSPQCHKRSGYKHGACAMASALMPSPRKSSFVLCCTDCIVFKPSDRNICPGESC